MTEFSTLSTGRRLLQLSTFLCEVKLCASIMWVFSLALLVLPSIGYNARFGIWSSYLGKIPQNFHGSSVQQRKSTLVAP